MCRELVTRLKHAAHPLPGAAMHEAERAPLFPREQFEDRARLAMRACRQHESLVTPVHVKPFAPRSPSGSSSPSRTGDAERRGRIGLEPPPLDLLAARETISAFAILYALQRRFHLLDAREPSPLRRLRHGLRLHRIHARQPSHALLVECYRRARGGTGLRKRAQLLDLFFERRPGPRHLVAVTQIVSPRAFRSCAWILSAWRDPVSSAVSRIGHIRNISRKRSRPRTK